MQEHSFQPSVKFSGIGVHFGKNIDMHIVQTQGNGIVFIRTDLSNIEIPALYTNVIATNSNTTIGTDGGKEHGKENAKIATIEHLMAALYACNIKHAQIFINSSEIPLMDGGSNDFIFGLEAAGFQPQKAQNLILKKEILVEKGDSHIKATPLNSLSIHSIIEFAGTSIGRQEIKFNETQHSFREYISYAKTFSHINFVRQMQAAGIAQGGDIYSATIFDNETVLSPKFSYNESDMPKHKILDFIGDISLCPYNIKGHFECYKSSHKINNMLISKIFEDKQNYEII